MRIELTCEGVEEMDEFQPNLQKCRKQYLDVGEEMKLLCDALAGRIGLLEADHVAADKERVEDGNRVCLPPSRSLFISSYKNANPRI